MELNQKIRELEDQIKLLKNEVKETLVDIREYILNGQNPFSGFEQSPEPLPLDEERVRARDKVPGEEPAARAEEAGAVEEGQGASGSGQGEASTDVEEVPSSPILRPVRPRVEQHRNGAMELGNLVGLTQWAGNAVKRIGRGKVEAIVEVYQLTGRLSPELKEVLLRLLHLAEEEKPEGQVTTRECIAVLVQLDALLGKGSRSEAALLSILFDEKEGLPSTRP